MSMLDGSAVLITGGTGSLGTSLIKTLLANTKVKRVESASIDFDWSGVEFFISIAIYTHSRSWGRSFYYFN